MRIARIRIENYRSIESLDFKPGALCALVGENNAGKSNVLRALNLILGDPWPSERMVSEEDFYNHDTSRDISACPRRNAHAPTERGNVGNSVPV